MFSQRTNWSLAKNRFTVALDELKDGGKAFVDLTESNPTACGLEFDDKKILGSLSDQACLKYEPTAQGLPVARKAVAEYYRQRMPLTDGPTEDIFLSTSTSEAYSHAFRLLCDPGDEVLIPHPGYPLFELLATIQDVTLVPYPLLYDHGWQIDQEALQSAVGPRTRAVIVVNPNNPTGSFIKKNEFNWLNQLCVKRNLAIVSDEVFLDYSFESQDAMSFAGNREALTFTMSGLSKVSGLPQMKVAWTVVSGPESLKRPSMERLELIADTYLSMSAPIQLATPALLESRHAFQRHLMNRLRRNLAELDGQLSGHKSCARLKIEGGWCAVLHVPVTQPDEELAIALMRDKQVVLHPGHFFDFPKDGYLIVSLMTSEKDFREGIKRVLEFVASR